MTMKYDYVLIWERERERKPAGFDVLDFGIGLHTGLNSCIQYTLDGSLARVCKLQFIASGTRREGCAWAARGFPPMKYNMTCIAAAMKNMSFYTGTRHLPYCAAISFQRARLALPTWVSATHSPCTLYHANYAVRSKSEQGLRTLDCHVKRN